MRTLLGRLIGPQIELRFELADVPCPLVADRSQLEQVVMNLAINARDAMETRRAADDRDRRAGRAGAPDRQRHRLGHGRRDARADLRALLHHQGGGQGHRAGALDRVRDRAPERRPDRGQQRAAAGDHVHDRPPARRGGAARGRRRKSPRRCPAAGPSRSSWSRTTRRSARSCAACWRRPATTCAWPPRREEALAGPDADLLVTDILMPGMNGRDLAARILERAPGTRVIFISGYTGDRSNWWRTPGSWPSPSRPASCSSRSRRCSRRDARVNGYPG